MRRSRGKSLTKHGHYSRKALSYRKAAHATSDAGLSSFPPKFNHSIYVTISYVCCDLTDPDQILPSTSGPFFQISQAVVVKFQLNPCVAVGFFVGSPTLCCYTPYQTVNHKRNNSASSLTARKKPVRTRQARGRVYNYYKKYFSSIPLLRLRRCNVKRTD